MIEKQIDNIDVPIKDEEGENKEYKVSKNKKMKHPENDNFKYTRSLFKNAEDIAERVLSVLELNQSSKVGEDNEFRTNKE